MKTLIAKPEDLTPQTTWLETKWAWTGEEELIDHTTKARLCAAAAFSAWLASIQACPACARTAPSAPTST